MTTPTPPVDAQWGVQWDVFAPADDVMPPQPPQPPPLSGEVTQEQQDAYQVALGEYNAEMDAWQAAVLALTADDANWRRTVAAFADRDAAEWMLTQMRATGNTDTARNFELAWAPSTTWTVVPFPAPAVG